MQATRRQSGQMKRPAQNKASHWLAILAATTCLVIIGGEFSRQVTASSITDFTQQQQQSQPSQLVDSPDKSQVAQPEVVAPAAAAQSAVIEPKSAAEPDQKPIVAEAANQQQQHQDQQQQQVARQARAETAASEPAPAAAPASPAAESSDQSKTSKPAAPEASAKKEKEATSAAPSKQKASSSKQNSGSKSNGNKSTTSSSSNGKPRFQANLGSTMLQGSVSQMSKHDAYSAIAEKHGALAQDAMRRSDKRRIGNGGGFGPAGIQKASGLGDIFNPTKMTDTGLARTLGASMRSMIKGKYSVPAYVASALLGAVALMAFYESPISPLPVPPLPEAPAGRFPPEMPNLPPGTQVPFRYNPNQNYNQRSFTNNGPLQQQQPMQLNQQQPAAQQQQQVFFPANQNQQIAQQRSSEQAGGSATPGSPAAMLSQVASNLLNVAKGPSQVAQRKSGSDSEPKSLFNPINIALKSNPLVGKLQNAQPKSSSGATVSTGSGFLSYFGLGGSSSAGQTGEGQMNGIGAMMMNQQQQPQVAVESKSGAANGAQSGASGFLNKFKSYFSSSAAASSPKPVSSSMSPSQPANSPSEASYNRINFIQNFMKDAKDSLPRIFSPTNRKANAPSSTPTGAASQPAQVMSNPTASNNGGQSSGLTNAQSMTNLFNNMAGINGGQMMAASSRAAPAGSEMSVSSGSAPGKTGKNGSGASGLMKVAHALLDSFSTMAQRNAAAQEYHGSSMRSASPQVNEQQDLSGSASQASNSPGNALQMFSDMYANFQQSAGAQQMASSQATMQAPSLNQDQQSSLIHQDAKAVQDMSKIQHGSAIAEPIARSSEASDIVIATDDGQASASYHHQPVNSQSSQQPQHQQAQPSARSQAASYQAPIQSQQQQQVQSAPAPLASSSNSASPVSQLAAASSAQQDQQSVSNSASPVHVRKTRSIGPDFTEPIPIANRVTGPAAVGQPSKAAQINAFVDYVADSYVQNKLLINFVMNQVGLSHAVPYVEQILASQPETTS